ncbi:hypothetical protein [Acetobacter indonesiensis]|uniref:hypothetical protein n=1 Tax=Acetobacter indonesiensis TaxID=104101 RepID=UPI0015C500F3|nr:hypothetical protein [Acetobacter indonesiensis]
MQKRADCKGRKKLSAACDRSGVKRSVALYDVNTQECAGQAPELPADVTRQHDGPFKDGVVGVIASEAFAEAEIQKTMQCNDLHNVRFHAG